MIKLIVLVVLPLFVMKSDAFFHLLHFPFLLLHHHRCRRGRLVHTIYHVGVPHITPQIKYNLTGPP